MLPVYGYSFYNLLEKFIKIGILREVSRKKEVKPLYLSNYC